MNLYIKVAYLSLRIKLILEKIEIFRDEDPT